MDQVTNLNIVTADFDGTIADTFTASPSGIGVEACYRMALHDMFGSATLLDEIGGLKNRASAQVIAAVLDLGPSLGRQGYRYYLRHQDRLRELVPVGKGANCKNATLENILTETLVRVRLQYLLPEIGDQWPKPYDGVLEYFEGLAQKGIMIGIISSGHTLFIKKAFNAWRARCPELLVTDDDMRVLGLPPSKACKPSRVLMDVLHMLLGRRISAHIKAYIGDCPIKDRGLARNADVRFGWFNPDNKSPPDGFGRNEFQFHSWRQVDRLLS